MKFKIKSKILIKTKFTYSIEDQQIYQQNYINLKI